MNRLQLPFAFACLALPLAAQTSSFVVPTKAQTVRPGSIWYDDSPQFWALWGNTGSTVFSRAQYLYAASDVGVPSALLQGFSFRSPYNYQQQAATYTTTVIVSESPTPPGSAQGTFAMNHGASPTTVFSGALSVPATTSMPWPQAFLPMIPFAAPVAWTGVVSQSLVIDYQTSASSNGRSWTMEGMRAEWGYSTNEHYQSNCRHSGGSASGGWGWNPSGLVPGGSFLLQLSGYPQNPSLATNALFFGLSGRGSPFGPFTTPFPLASLGLPAPANCEWSIDVIGGAGFPMTYSPSGTSALLSMSNVPFPNTPSFAGAVLYTQNLALDLDPVRGTPNQFPSIAIKWLIGTGNTIPCTAVTNLSSSGIPTTGGVRQSEAAVTQFWY